MVFPNQVKRLNDLGRNSEQFLKHERDLLSLVGDFLDVSEDEFEIFWNGQVCNEGDGGVCCKKNYELTNGVVVKIKKIVLHLIIQTTKITMMIIKSLSSSSSRLR